MKFARTCTSWASGRRLTVRERALFATVHEITLSPFPLELDDELAKDLQEFEVVSGSDSGKVDEDEINRELENFDIK